jgi:hypothetical protein
MPSFLGLPILSLFQELTQCLNIPKKVPCQLMFSIRLTMSTNNDFNLYLFLDTILESASPHWHQHKCEIEEALQDLLYRCIKKILKELNLSKCRL